MSLEHFRFYCRLPCPILSVFLRKGWETNDIPVYIISENALVAPERLAQPLAGGVGAGGVGPGVDGGLIVLELWLPLAVHVAALSGGEQGTNLELRADVFRP